MYYRILPKVVILILGSLLSLNINARELVVGHPDEIGIELNNLWNKGVSEDDTVYKHYVISLSASCLGYFFNSKVVEKDVKGKIPDEALEKFSFMESFLQKPVIDKLKNLGYSNAEKAIESGREFAIHDFNNRYKTYKWVYASCYSYVNENSIFKEQLFKADEAWTDEQLK